ncbi:13025_t:CDS:2 [Funneliformis geosporum]|uniref:13025_t:CDS:1 n=1 Tax=Funneliformis geosporum TaxID=1117311 RepID=A0A9W4SBP9_9GLOM|nr:13025_t:CDS:2 [Funneliformis geosporum]
MTLTTAGHEAINSSMSWALYLLAQHPHEQDLLREELVRAFPDKSNFNPTFDEINTLEYLNCIVKEVLRLYPILTTLQRVNAKDQTFGEYFIPKGTTLDIPIFTLHRLPSIWGPTADIFDPKRWLNPSLIKDVTNYNYLPFSAGIRFCLGHKIGLIEIKILLSVLIRNFVFQTVKGFPLKKKAGFVSKPDSSLKLAVSKVEI